MPKVKNLNKLPKRKVTVGDLLDRDNLVDTIDDVRNNLDIEGLIIIYRLPGDDFRFSWANMSYKDRVYALTLTLNHEINTED